MKKTVLVRRHYNDHRVAEYKLEDVSKIHWDNISGGVREKSSNYSLYGYVDCQGMVGGELSHSGIHGPCPHEIKVCILKGDNKDIYNELEEQAGPRPRKFPPQRKHHCITDIKDILKNVDEPMSKNELLEKLIERGHTSTALSAAVKKHKDIIEISRLNEDRRQYAYKLKKEEE